MGSSSETLDGTDTGTAGNLDPPASPFTPLFFTESPESPFPLMDCLENLLSPVTETNGERQPENEPVAMVTDNSLLSQKNPSENQWELENLEDYDEFFDWSPENNVTGEQQQLENLCEFYVDEGLPKEPSEQIEQPSPSHTTPILPGDLIQRQTQQNNPTMMEINQQAGQNNELQQANMVNFDDEFSDFEFPGNIQTEHHCPLIQPMDQPKPFSSVYDQIVHNFSKGNSSKNNYQTVSNLDLVSRDLTQARVKRNIQMQQWKPLHYMHSSSTGTRNYQTNSLYQQNSFLSSSNPYGKQEFSSFGTRPTLLRPLQPHHFNELPYGYVFADQEEPLALRMARAATRKQSLNDPHCPDADCVLAPRTYALLNQCPTPTLTGPLQDISLLPRSQSFLSASSLQSTQGLMNQSSRASSLYPRLGNQKQGSYLNTTIQVIGGHLNEQPSIRSYLIGTTTNNCKGKRTLGQQSHGELFEHGQPSKWPRIKKTHFGQEESSRSESIRTSLSQEENSGPRAGDPFDSRPAKNAVYDPLFEAVGLSADPHLRLFGIS